MSVCVYDHLYTSQVCILALHTACAPTSEIPENWPSIGKGKLKKSSNYTIVQLMFPINFNLTSVHNCVCVPVCASLSF